ncbi:hypothetical protein Chor_004436 [Crotalus horridus]
MVSGNKQIYPLPDRLHWASQLYEESLGDLDDDFLLQPANREVGETWHPFLRIYGIVECVLCTCNGTKPECKTIKCPHQYPCEEPKKIEGKCCKVCPEEIESQLPDDEDYFCGEETFPVYEAIVNTSRKTLQRVALEKNETSEVEIYTWTFKRGAEHFLFPRSSP